jgi:hypothetical protein
MKCAKTYSCNDFLECQDTNVEHRISNIEEVRFTSCVSNKLLVRFYTKTIQNNPLQKISNLSPARNIFLRYRTRDIYRFQVNFRTVHLGVYSMPDPHTSYHRLLSNCCIDNS